MALKAGRHGVNRSSVDWKGNVHAPTPEPPEIEEASPGEVGGVLFTAASAGKVLAVKSDGSALEWVDPPEGGEEGVPGTCYLVEGRGISSSKIVESADECLIVFDIPEGYDMSTSKHGALRLSLSSGAGATVNLYTYSFESLEIDSTGAKTSTAILTLLSSDTSKSGAGSIPAKSGAKYVVFSDSHITADKITYATFCMLTPKTTLLGGSYNE